MPCTNHRALTSLPNQVVKPEIRHNLPPDASRFGEYLRAGIILIFLFGVVFYGADFIAAMRAERFKLYFAWEREIPFLPIAYVVYYSVVLLPLLVSVLVPTAARIRRWRNRMSATLVIAGAIFLLLPTEVGFDYVVDTEWSWVKQITTVVAGRYNLVPSLHVALTVVTLLTLWPLVGRVSKGLFMAWAVALALSTLLTHQHHVLDVAAGLLLGALVCRRVSLD